MRGLNHSAIESPRLYYVPATVELTEADLAGPESLAAALGVTVPVEWPPELYSRPALMAVLQQLADRAEHGWSTWYLVGRVSEKGLVGVCGFKGRPDVAGSVEISYSICPAQRNVGYASEAVERLSRWAFSHTGVQTVTAETLPYLRQSIRVLEKNGFQRTGQGSEYGVVRYALSKSSLR
jgi:RimJ/RimL family protein N-acetyltransferase